jgi:YidC/Oxa1 family membrane protein insertase
MQYKQPETAKQQFCDVDATSANKNIKDDQFPAGNQITWENDKFVIEFFEEPASAKEIAFKDFRSCTFELINGFQIKKDLIFNLNYSSPESIIFIYKGKDKEILKKFTRKGLYNLDLEIEIRNLTDVQLEFDTSLVLGTFDLSKSGASQYEEVVIALEDKVLRSKAKKDNFFDQVKFVGMRGRYFCGIIAPEVGKTSAYIHKVTSSKSEIGLELDNLSILPKQRLTKKFNIYVGPQDTKLISSVNNQWAAIIHYGTFDIIAVILLNILKSIYNLVHNWGIAIILLSILIYILLYPLSLRQMKSMKEMQAIQPEIEKLRIQYKENPQKLNKEIMELYKIHKINPFSGCLPLILQLPIFIALYQALIRTVSLKGASFLWIKDLSEPDQLFTITVSFPVIGNHINILPILMAVTMFFQQKFSMAPTRGSSEQQKIMTILFPIMFGFIFYNMPSGLVLYWFTNSIFMLAYQIKTRQVK